MALRTDTEKVYQSIALWRILLIWAASILFTGLGSILMILADIMTWQGKWPPTAGLLTSLLSAYVAFLAFTLPSLKLDLTSSNALIYRGLGILIALPPVIAALIFMPGRAIGPAAVLLPAAAIAFATSRYVDTPRLKSLPTWVQVLEGIRVVLLWLILEIACLVYVFWRFAEISTA